MIIWSNVNIVSNMYSEAEGRIVTSDIKGIKLKILMLLTVKVENERKDCEYE